MNRYFKEVLDAHDLIQSWLGDGNSKHDICENLLSHFSPQYLMITTSGALLDFNALSSFFRTQHGVREGLEIEIKDMKIISENETGATVFYKELQQLPEQDATLRYSTVVFELDQAGRVIWKHLHETATSIDSI